MSCPDCEFLEVIIDNYVQEFDVMKEKIKHLKYELHIARTSAILLKHTIDGEYD